MSLSEPRHRRFIPLIDAACLLAPILVWVTIIFDPAFRPDADSYYHFGVARLYASEGWLSSFPWMKFSVLAADFPNVHLLQHLFLAPLAALFPPLLGLKLGMLLMSTALLLSAFLVLRRWKVPFPGLSLALVALSSPAWIALMLAIKGGSLFAILFIWFLDALVARAHKRSFLLAWLSAYAYVGAPILLLVLLIDLVAHRIWNARWDLAPLKWSLLGLTFGILLNPFWPGHVIQIYAELTSALFTPEIFVAGDLRGSEWMSLTGTDFIRLFGAPTIAWGLLLLVQLRRAQPIPHTLATGILLSLAFLGGAVLKVKFAYQMLIASLVFLPSAFHTLVPNGLRLRLPVVAVAAFVAVTSSTRAHRDFLGTPALLEDDAPEASAGDGSDTGDEAIPDKPDTTARRLTTRPLPRDYEYLADWLIRNTASGDVVVTAWDDFPGLFFFNTHNHYVIGLNTDFLRRFDETRFKAYLFLFRGRVKDPEKALPQFFDAKLVALRASPRNNHEKKLLTQLADSPHFDELPTATTAFRLFRLRAVPR
jgi:hypothetical protein